MGPQIGWWLCVPFLLSSWGCHATVEIEYPVPATFNVSSNIYNLALVTVVGTEDAEQIVRGVAASLDESRWFKITNLSRSQAEYRRQTPDSSRSLNRTAAKSICKASQATAILALEQLVTNKNTMSSGTATTTETSFIEGQISGDELVLQGWARSSTGVLMKSWTRVVNATAHWVLYDCSGQIITTYSKLGGNLGMIAHRSASHIRARKATTLRKVYVPMTRPSRKAFAHFSEGNLNRSRNIWSEMLRDAQGLDRAMVLHNLAVCSEANGEPFKALRTALESQKAWGLSYPHESYISFLQRRAVEQETLKEQIEQRQKARRP